MIDTDRTVTESVAPRALVVGDTVRMGGITGNLWRITEIRTVSPHGVAYPLSFTGYSAEYIGKPGPWCPRPGTVADGSFGRGPVARVTGGSV